jgi:hypothetical protein
VLAATYSSILIGQSTGAFTPVGNMTAARVWHTATLLNNGKVLLAGGVSNQWPLSLASTELYDASTGAFKSGGDMTVARSMHTATLLSNGDVLIAGGIFLNSAELYNPETETFRVTGAMLTARYDHTAILLRNGRVLIAGGRPPNGNGALASAELYDPATGVFTATGNMSRARSRHTATLLANGNVLIEGGAGLQYPSGELYDSDNGVFSPATPSGDKATPGDDGSSTTSTLLLDGRVLLTLGGPWTDDPSPAAELYDPSAGSFTATRPMNAVRATQTAVLLSNGTVLVAGGDYRFSATEVFSSGEIYDPATGAFSASGRMTIHRVFHTSTLLVDGTVLIAGGQTFNGSPRQLDTAEIYRPAVVLPAPSLLSFPQGNGAQGAILHAGTNRLVSGDDPAIVGEPLEIYFTGLIGGSVVPPQLAIGGRTAEILWFGRAPGFTGLNQMNVRLPMGVAPGPAVPVRLTYLGRPSNEVNIGVR